MAEKKDNNVEQRLDRLEGRLEGLSRDVASISTLMNENQEEIRRLFGVKGEDHDLRLKTIAEGYQASRERLDDHEDRITKLEAS